MVLCGNGEQLLMMAKKLANNDQWDETENLLRWDSKDGWLSLPSDKDG